MFSKVAHNHPLLSIFKNALVKAAVAKGASVADAEKGFDLAASAHPILDMLFNGGFEKVLAFILEIIAAFSQTPA